MTENQTITNIFKKNKNKLLNYIKRNISSGISAEDILQDVFYSLIAGVQQAGMLENVSSWLFTATRNRITDVYRKKKQTAFSDLELLTEDDEESLSLLDLLPSDQSLPDDELIKNIFWEEVESALDELPKNQREVFILNEFENYSFKEISEILGVPLNTLLSRKRYAVKYLKTRLQNLNEEL